MRERGERQTVGQRQRLKEREGGKKEREGGKETKEVWK